MRNVHGTLPARRLPSFAPSRIRLLHERGALSVPDFVRKRHLLAAAEAPEPTTSAIEIRTFFTPPTADWPAQRKSIVRPTKCTDVGVMNSELREIELRGTDAVQTDVGPGVVMRGGSGPPCGLPAIVGVVGGGPT